MKTNTGLVDYARASLNLPYWYGTYGNTASASLYAEKKQQYPSNYAAGNFASQYGKRVHDCVGLIKGYIWSDTPTSPPKYDTEQDCNVGELKHLCKEHGPIATLPELPGVLVFMDNEHVGVYEGNGHVIEAKGHAYGVIRSAIADTEWTDWGKCPWISYGAAPIVPPDLSGMDIKTAIAAAKAFLNAVGAKWR